jgi:hypothetical protein
MLPLPQKPKKRGHHALPASGEEEAPVIVGRQGELGEQHAVPQEGEALAPAPTGPEPGPSARTLSDKGPARTIYSDHEIDEFLHHVRVEAAIARLDLTHSAVWRRAMHELMERCSPRQVVEHFAEAAIVEQGRVGRPRR